MKYHSFLTLAASSLAMSLAITGCSAGGFGSVASASSAPKPSKAPSYAAKAEKALAKQKYTEAVQFAELAVAAMPQEAGFRYLLGRTYVAAGRFASAERSFLDAMELGQSDPGVVLNLAMSQLAQNKSNKALQLVREHQNIIPAGDFGLALAIAGDASGAVEVLSDAIRSGNVGPRTRQNLALAYALNGQWREAKLMASQDIAPAEVDSRIMEWAQIARPGAYEARVAALLGVQPDSNDPGQPVQLALRNSDPVAAVLTAQADAKAEDGFNNNAAPQAELAAIGPSPRGDTFAAETSALVTPVALPASNSAPEKAAQDKPVRVSGRRDFVVEGSAAKPAVQRVAATAAPKPQPVSGGTHLVQLGAFSSPDLAKAAWGKLVARHPNLRDFQYASSRVTVNGKTLYRLAAMGFGNQSSANAMCSGIKSRGGACIVRYVSGVNPRQLAAKGGADVASR